MRILVKAVVFDPITEAPAIKRLREQVGAQIQKIVKSGKLELGWVAVDSRMPMFILNVNSSSEVMGLLGSVFIDNFKIELHPIVSLEELGKFFKDYPVG